jgi:hypothetical protein
LLEKESHKEAAKISQGFIPIVDSGTSNAEKEKKITQSTTTTKWITGKNSINLG